MKKLNDDIFLKNLPTLDLHGEIVDSAILYVKDFILENLTLKKPKIVIVHGIGDGLLKKGIHDFLKNNKYVLKYYLVSYNLGVTIIELKVDNY